MKSFIKILLCLFVSFQMEGSSSEGHIYAKPHKLSGNIVDIENRAIYPGEITIENGIISQIRRLNSVAEGAPYYLPGFIDGHIHIESSMLTPANFARLAVAHGTIGVMADPHEITNVLGEAGLDYMLDNAKGVNFNFWYGVPSCVPSSHLETAGAVIDAAETERLLQKPGITHLAEMMNYPGVISGDADVMGKIAAARRLGKPIDGHAPGVAGAALDTYIGAGISTDHECSTVEEARERLSKGMKVIIREGSSARNFDALIPVITGSSDMVMFCSDDKHPDDLLVGHIDAMIRKGLSKGYDVWDLLTAACITPIKHYGLGSGNIRQGESATFIAVDNLKNLNVLETYINGHKVYDSNSGVTEEIGTTHVEQTSYPNNFKAVKITSADIKVDFDDASKVRVITASDGALITGEEIVPAGAVRKHDIQKIVVYNRYGNDSPKVAYIKGFKLNKGAIGATIAHDSHNIIAIGADDEDIVKAINSLIDAKGGIVVTDGERTKLLNLPIAGLMSPDDGETVARAYRELLKEARNLGCEFRSPFITMSFMALPVIPALKLTDKGLVDVTLFDFVPLVLE